MNKLLTVKNVLNGRFFILILVAFTCGASSHLSFAPYNIQWLAPLSLATLYAILATGSQLSAKQHFWLGLGFGAGLFSFGVRWVHVSIDNFGGLPLAVSLTLMLLLSLYLALFPAACCYLFARLKSKSSLTNALLFSSLWVLSELARGKLLTGFPWLWLGYSQTTGIFSQNAATIGVIGLSLMISLVATFFASLVMTREFKPLVGLISTLLLAIGLNQISTTRITDERVDVALVQGNIEQSAKWQADKMWPTISTYMDLTRDNFDADIIFWPEAAMPAVEDWVVDYLRLMDKTASFRDSAIVTGLIAREPAAQTEPSLSQPPEASRYYNALVSVGNSQQKTQKSGDYQPQHNNRYYKHQLLPIGEFVPFETLLRPLAPLFNLPMSSFYRGDWQQPNLTAVGYEMAAAICYEIAFPELVRANMTRSTDLLLTVSNDAWFGRSIGPHQHMEIAQARAIELGRPLIRVTNNGITAIVDARGTITSQLPQFEQGVLRAKVPLVTGQTYFYRWGQWPVIGLTLLCVAVVAARRLVTAKSSNADALS